jgi:hypothetical protein
MVSLREADSPRAAPLLGDAASPWAWQGVPFRPVQTEATSAERDGRGRTRADRRARAWLWVLVDCSGGRGGNGVRGAGSGGSDGRKVVVGIGRAAILGNLRVAVIPRGGGADRGHRNAKGEPGPGFPLNERIHWNRIWTPASVPQGPLGLWESTVWKSEECFGLALVLSSTDER